MTVEVSHEFSCSTTQLWAAITEHELMIQWYFDNIPAFEARVGFRTNFPVKSADRIFHHEWKVTEVQEGGSIAYEWTFPDLPGVGLVTFELSGPEGRTLTIRDEVLEAFPQDIPEFNRKSCEEGWKYFMGRLADFLT